MLAVLVVLKQLQLGQQKMFLELNDQLVIKQSVELGIQLVIRNFLEIHLGQLVWVMMVVENFQCLELVSRDLAHAQLH